jgi:hypothetical protein
MMENVLRINDCMTKLGLTFLDSFVYGSVEWTAIFCYGYVMISRIDRTESWRLKAGP